MTFRNYFRVLALAFVCLLWVAPAFAQSGPGRASFVAAENLRKQKRFQEAIPKYDEAIKLEPQNHIYHFAKGKCYYSLKDMDLALAALEESVNLKKEYTPALTMMAKIYRTKNDDKNASYYYDQAFRYEQNPEKKVAYKMECVKLALKAQDVDEAQRHIREAKAVAPDNLNILYYDAKISNQNGDHESAKQSMMAALPKLEGQPPAQVAKYYYELGLACYRTNDYNNANKYWEKAYFPPYKQMIDRERSKNSPAYFYRIAVAYYSGQEYAAAKAMVNKALELQSNFAAGHMLMGKIAKKQGNFNQAISSFENAASMEEDPAKRAKIQLMLANLQLDAGDYSGAASNASRFLDANPGNPQALYTKAMALYHSGSDDAAISILEQLVTLSGNDAKAKAKYQFTIGMAAKGNDVEKAKVAFKAAMVGPYKAAAKNELDALLGNK